MAGNKITKNLNVAAGADRSAGRKYPLKTEVHQESGGYKGLRDSRHVTPNDKALENSYQRKVGQWGVSLNYPKAAAVNVNEGNLHGGANVYKGKC